MIAVTTRACLAIAPAFLRARREHFTAPEAGRPRGSGEPGYASRAGV